MNHAPTPAPSRRGGPALCYKMDTMAKNNKKPDPKAAQGPQCPFCGRRNTVKRMEGQVYYCGHCEKMFQP